mgnify:CR=1 FL=1
MVFLIFPFFSTTTQTNGLWNLQMFSALTKSNLIQFKKKNEKEGLTAVGAIKACSDVTGAAAREQLKRGPNRITVMNALLNTHTITLCVLDGHNTEYWRGAFTVCWWWCCCLLVSLSLNPLEIWNTFDQVWPSASASAAAAAAVAAVAAWLRHSRTESPTCVASGECRPITDCYQPVIEVNFGLSPRLNSARAWR